MKREFTVVVVVLIIGSGGVIVFLNSGTTVDNQEQPLTIDVEWGVEIGDEFIYLLSVTGGVYANQNNQTDPPDFIELDDLTLRFQITDLPDLPHETDNESFLNEVIYPIKFTCSFENTSTVPEPIKSRLCELLSWTLIPIGDWDVINGLYNTSTFAADFLTGIYGQKKCYTTMHDNSFSLMIGHQKASLQHNAEKWDGDIALTNGLSRCATYSDYNFDEYGAGEALHITLNLLS